jgi:GT2 family glycosyltransferase
MKVSIVIPNYNGEKFLEACFNSLAEQTFKDYEVIFVDNFSADKSCEMVKENYPNVKIIKLDKNYGFSKAVNEGIKASDSEFVVLLNNDTAAEKDWLEKLVCCVEGDNKIFSCCSKMIQYHKRKLIDDAGDEYSALGWTFKRGENASVLKFSEDRRVFSSCGGAAIYRRCIFKKIGYFDEGFFAYMEDVDICFRANIKGYKNIFCSGAKIYHIGSGTTGSRYNSLKVKLAARNNVYVVLKNMPLALIIINSPFLIMGFLIKYAFFSSKGFSNDYKSGFIEGLKNGRKSEKVRFEGKNLINYTKIELSMLYNVLKGIYYKISK